MTTVLLDVDGTLVDSNDAHALAWVRAFAEEGVDVPFEAVRRLIGMGGDKLIPRVSPFTDDSKEGKRVATRRQEIFAREFLPRLQPFRDAAPAGRRTEAARTDRGGRQFGEGRGAAAAAAHR